MEWIGKNKKAIALLRVSSAKQDNISHEVQEKEVREYCERNGLELAIEPDYLTESASDSDKRKKYRKFIQNALAKNIRHLLFYMYDRETRNLTDIEANEKLVKQGVIVLHYVRDAKVLHAKSSDSDFLVRDMQAITNKHFIRNLRAKVTDAMRTKAESGWYPSNRPPLGYMTAPIKDENGKEKKRGVIIVPDENSKNVKQVQREFELRAQGYSYMDIRRKIVEENFIPHDKVRHYHDSMIEYRLKNPFYYGRFRWQGLEYDGKHELIIPKSILEAVRSRFGKRKNKVDLSGEHGLFMGGWLTCATCGCNVVYDPHKKVLKSTGEVKIFHLYHCTNGKGVHSSMRGMYAKEEDMWEQFRRVVEKVEISPKLAKQITDALNETHEKACATTRKQMEVYRESLKVLEAKEDKAYDAFQEEVIDKDQYRRQVQRIREDRAHLIDLLEKAQLNLNGAYKETVETTLELATNAKSLWNSGSAWERRDFLNRVLSNQVLNGLTVEFDLKKPFQALMRMRQSEEWWAL